MAITEKHRRRRRRKHSHGEQNTVDRISELPDSVLCQILYFLPSTKDSVRTSVLGKRWRYLWTYVPTLDFRNENAEHINSVMSRHKSQTVDDICLVHEIDCTARQLETWVSFAVMRNVQKLGLHFHSQDCLPRSLFTCKTLVYVTLSACGVIPVSGAVCLPRLKTLHLIHVQFEADESLPHLLSGCPVLEKLEIHLFKNMVRCNVSSPTIKRFALTFRAEDSSGRSERLEINTPAIQFLKINNSPFERIKFGAHTSLTEANISFYNGHLYSRSLLEFVDSLCNVESLALDLKSCPQIVDSVLSAWTTSFRNLTLLQLTADWRFLLKFLANADNLKILVFREHCIEREEWTEPTQQVPTCLLSSLRMIKLIDIQGEKHEFQMIRYLLRNAKVLFCMEIAYPDCLPSDEEIVMLKRISLLRRGSTLCEVAFDRMPFGAKSLDA